MNARGASGGAGAGADGGADGAGAGAGADGAGADGAGAGAGSGGVVAAAHAIIGSIGELLQATSSSLAGPQLNPLKTILQSLLFIRVRIMSAVRVRIRGGAAGNAVKERHMHGVWALTLVRGYHGYGYRIPAVLIRRTKDIGSSPSRPRNGVFSGFL